jgi:hypothetical protein
MQRHSTDDVLKRAIRAKVCTTCSQRPDGSESLPPDVPRSCEPLCAIFTNVPRLIKIATLCADAPVSYERALKELVCARCTLAPSSGEYCSDFNARTCPLSRYARDVLQLIDQVGVRRNVSAPTDQQ